MAAERIYKVKRGDCLWTIAKEAYGDPQFWKRIAETNRLRNPNLLFIGQQLLLPQLSPSHAIGSGVSTPPPEAAVLARDVAYPELHFDIDGKEIHLYFPEFDITVKLQGSLTIKKKGFGEHFEFSDSEVSIKYKPPAQDALRGVLRGATVSLHKDGSLGMSVSGGAMRFVALPNPNGNSSWAYSSRPIKKECGGFENEGTLGFVVELKKHDNDNLAADRAAVVQRVKENFIDYVKFVKPPSLIGVRIPPTGPLQYVFVMLLIAGLARAAI